MVKLFCEKLFTRPEIHTVSVNENDIMNFTSLTFIVKDRLLAKQYAVQVKLATSEVIYKEMYYEGV